MPPIKLLGLELAAMIALLVIGPKLNTALPTFRILFPFCDCVMLPALRTRIAHRELPIFLDFHEARPSDGWTGMLWPPSIRATVDAEVELVKPLPVTPIYIVATHLHCGMFVVMIVMLRNRRGKEARRYNPSGPGVELLRPFLLVGATR